MRDNRFNGVGGGMNCRIGCIHNFSNFMVICFNLLVSFVLDLDLLVPEVNLSGRIKYLSY